MEPTQSSMKPESRVKQYDRPVTGLTTGEMDELVQREDIDQDRLMDQSSIDQVARDSRRSQGGQNMPNTMDTEPMDILVQREDKDPDMLRDRDDIPRQASSARQQQSSTGQQQQWSSTGMGQQSKPSGTDEMSKFRADLDDLVARIPGLSEMDLNAAKEKLLSSFSSYRQTAMNYASEARQQLNQRVEATGEYVKEKPMQSLGVAAGIGFLIGLLVSRR